MTYPQQHMAVCWAPERGLQELSSLRILSHSPYFSPRDWIATRATRGPVRVERRLLPQGGEPGVGLLMTRRDECWLQKVKLPNQFTASARVYRSVVLCRKLAAPEA